ncbi:MAG TPA: hypothetical protein VI485_16065 [Vicinamibacterales bacterium]|nr:hypothetical protein [Vicinamibacterales bacterium]
MSPKALERYGAFNISLVSDLPLFVDPFLVFNSRKPRYRKLHRGIVRYLQFLYKMARAQSLTPGLIASWYRFPEIRENWLGFSQSGNQGRGLGSKFADALHSNLGVLFQGLNRDKITKDVHLEKLCLVSDRVGRDNISDFTTNLIHAFLLEYTSTFAKKYIDRSLRKTVAVSKVSFNYQTQTWTSGQFDLPFFQGAHVLLTPRDLLTKEDTWINKTDLFEDFDQIPDAIPNEHLRQQVSNFFRSLLPKPTKKRRRIKKTDRDAAIQKTLQQFPFLIDYYIRHKEGHGDEAKRLSSQRVELSDQLYVQQINQLRHLLETTTTFYASEVNSYEAAYRRAQFLKDVIENKGCHKVFYAKGQPIEREADLQILYRFTWFGTSFDVGREANDGRGPVDYKISKGATDKSLVEMKLGSNSSLERNLKKQTDIYAKASDAQRSVTIIICLSAADQARVRRILRRLKREGDRSIVVIDARKDNKPSGSKA